ncbi:MAG: hypothetical protein KTR32_08160 [Granulosicoccus sp.]|nr:hypothetical protein [Granulosicoccus sp.]
MSLLTKQYAVSLVLCFQMCVATSWAQSSDNLIACDEPYVVAPGDTLLLITQRVYGSDNIEAVYELNKSVIGSDPNMILIDTKLNLPCGLDLDLVQSVAQADFSGSQGETQNNLVKAETPLPSDGETILVFNRAASPKFIINVGIVDEYLAQITQATDGRVRFVDPPEVERDPRAQLDLVLSGEVDGAYIFNGHLAESHPLLQLPMHPLMGGTAEQTALSLWRLHEKHLSRTDYFDGVELLGFIGAPAAHIWRLQEVPVLPGEDIQESNEYTVPYFDGLDTRGASAVQEENAAWLAKFDEQDGKSPTMVMAHGAALAGGIWKDNNRTVTEIRNGVYTPTFSVFLSEEAWAKISPADKAVIKSISGEVLSQKSAAWDLFDNGLRFKMMDQGLNVVEADMALLAELQDQSRIGLENWIAEADASGISGYTAVNDYLENLKLLARER